MGDANVKTTGKIVLSKYSANGAATVMVWRKCRLLYIFAMPTYTE